MLLLCVTVFLSYLPEAGQYSSFFLYLKQVMVTWHETSVCFCPLDYLSIRSRCVFQVIEFSPAAIVAFIAMVGTLSIIVQVHREAAHASWRLKKIKYS